MGWFYVSEMSLKVIKCRVMLECVLNSVTFQYSSAGGLVSDNEEYLEVRVVTFFALSLVIKW